MANSTRYSTYSRDANQKNILEIRKLIIKLPVCVAEFIQSIQDNTTTLTRLAYVRDLHVFFTYLTNECPNFAGKEIALLTTADMNAITQHDLSQYPDYLSLYFKSIERNDNTSEERAIENSASGIMRKLCCLRSFYSFLFTHKYVDSNVAELIPLPKLREHAIIHLEPNEVARLLDLAENGEELSDREKKFNKHTSLRDVAILTVLLGTGIRVSECVGLDLNDINFDDNALRVIRKGDKEMILYYSDEVANALKNYIKVRNEINAIEGHENALFLSLQKRRITQRAVQLLVKKYASIAAPLRAKVSPHKLRSTYGTTLYQETGDIYLVADVLGHTDVNTTRKHYAAMSEEKRRIAGKSVKLRDD